MRQRAEGGDIDRLVRPVLCDLAQFAGMVIEPGADSGVVLDSAWKRSKLDCIVHL